MMRFVPLLLILLISCSPLKKYPLKSDRWENDIKFLESKDRIEKRNVLKIVFYLLEAPVFVYGKR